MGSGDLPKGKRQRKTPWLFWLALVALALALLVNLLFFELRPGNAWGMAYGIAAALIMLGVFGIVPRRRTMRLSSRLRLGRASFWLNFHIYGGTLFLLLMFMHAGMRPPVGALTLWLWILSIWTVVSGWAGFLLQRWIPRVLSSGLSIEVNYDRIPELIQDIRERADRLIETCDEPIRTFYQRELASVMEAPRRRLIYFIDITGGIQNRVGSLDFLRGFLNPSEKKKLAQLERLYKTKLEIDAHYTLQQALRWWLYGHVPFSLIMLVFVGLHIFTVLRY